MLPDIQPGNTKILYFFNCLLDGMHTTFRERPVEFIKKEPDDKPGYVMNDHLSNSAVASSL